MCNSLNDSELSSVSGGYKAPDDFTLDTKVNTYVQFIHLQLDKFASKGISVDGFRKNFDNFIKNIQRRWIAMKHYDAMMAELKLMPTEYSGQILAHLNKIFEIVQLPEIPLSDLM